MSYYVTVTTTGDREYSSEPNVKTEAEAASLAIKVRDSVGFSKFVDLGDNTYVRADLIEAIEVFEE